jgi:glycosyltransferase involved in cell wall biosynthesis
MTKPRVAFLVNFVAPARVAVYERLAATLDLVILHGGMESNRTLWEEMPVEGASVRRVSGWQLSLDVSDRGQKIDHWYLHIEPGYITELVRERPDAVITDEMGFRTMVGLAYGACSHKPVWVWWGGTLHTERRVGWFRNLLRAVVARWAKRWISYGQTSTEYLMNLGIPRERILQVQNCVDESWYRVPSASQLEVQPKPVLLCAGRMVAGKGVAEYLRAVARLQKEGLTFSTVLVGGGCDTPKLRRLAVELCLSHIHFYPNQPPRAMPGFYLCADVLIFPTMEDVWGLVANEAVLSGVPVLCSRYAGCAPELFDPECIFDPADEEQFVTALRKAVRGQLPPTDRSRLWSSAKVGEVIANAVLASCVGQLSRTEPVKADAIPQSMTRG